MNKPKSMRLLSATTAVLASLSGLSLPVVASSHREAPMITQFPKVDGTDVYAFRSYEPGRQDYVTLIANYIPLQDSYGGPNYFKMDPDALYEIHIDNNGDAREDLTFQFKFKNTSKDIALNTISSALPCPVSMKQFA